MDKNNLHNAIYESFKSICLTNNIHYSGSREQVEICLTQNGMIGNMQEDESAFEAWALLIHHYFQKNSGAVVLSVDETVSLPKYDEMKFDKDKHYRRFLYRAFKFKNQFGSWFRLSETLEQRALEFEQYLCDKNNVFINNKPSKESGTKKKPEDKAETFFASVGTPKLHELARKNNTPIGQSQIYRQLPVSLFDKTTKAQIFTGKGSAIDLWTIEYQTISIFELKAKNCKVGIISELMFYANYTHDMYGKNQCSFSSSLTSKKQPDGNRGYGKIAGTKFETIQAFFLTDRIHPLIEAELEIILKLMNENTLVKYGSLTYDWSDVEDYFSAIKE